MANVGLIRERPKGSGSWQVVIRVGGERYQFGPRSTPELGSMTRGRAEEWMLRKRGELLKRAQRATEGLSTGGAFSALLEQFEAEEMPTLTPGTQKSYRDSLGPIQTYFVGTVGDPALDKIHAKHIKSYLTWRRVRRLDGGKGTVSNRTLAKDRAVLHRLFSFAERLELREGNPVARVAAPKSDGRDPILLTPEQYERLLSECAERPMLYLYALLLGETGCRAYSEALTLRWEDIDLEAGFVWIASGREGRRTKSGKGRWTPMTPRLRQAMRDHFAAFHFAAYSGRRSPWVFHHLTTRRRHKAGDRIKDFRGAFDAAAKRAELPEGFRRHDLRHRRVTTWLAAGKDVVHVKEAVGHSDLRTTMGYTHLSREHLRSLVDEEAPGAVEPQASEASYPGSTSAHCLQVRSLQHRGHHRTDVSHPP